MHLFKDDSTEETLRNEMLYTQLPFRVYGFRIYAPNQLQIKYFLIAFVHIHGFFYVSLPV